MRDVLLRLARLAAASLAVIGLAAAWAGIAAAANPGSGSISDSSPSTSWRGAYYALHFNPEMVPCPPGSGPLSDPVNLVCDHFTLDVQTAGTVTVTISWPDSSNDFDLFVYDSNNMQVASAATPNDPETVKFDAAVGTYEVRVDPAFVIDSEAQCPGQAPGELAGYCGTATLAVPPPPPPPPPIGGVGTGGGIDPPLSVSNASVREGDSGTTAATFAVTLGSPTTVPVTVNYVTADAWADGTATPAVDFVPVTGTVVIPPGQTRATFSVPVVGDTEREANDTFLVNLYLPDPPLAVARIEDGQGVGTIRNDDWRHWVSGSGKIGLPLGAQGYFSLRADEGLRGKIGYRDASIRFNASNITSYVYNDATATATISGNGWNAGHAVTYVLEARDNGPTGTLDSLVLTLSDGSRVSGTLTSGDIQYHS